MDIPSFVITGLIGMSGVVAGYGALRIMANRNTADIQELKTEIDGIEKRFVPQTECALKHDQVCDKLDSVKSMVIDQEHTTKRLVNFAMHQLTNDGMSLSEAQNILENGRR